MAFSNKNMTSMGLDPMTLALLAPRSNQAELTGRRWHLCSCNLLCRVLLIQAVPDSFPQLPLLIGLPSVLRPSGSL